MRLGARGALRALTAALSLVLALPATAQSDDVFSALSQLCGQSFAGQVLIDQPPSADDAFAGRTLIMHVRECSDDTLRIPFHVGDDRSRTWVLSRNGDGLRLQHEHRHEDGSDDAVSPYGGQSSSALGLDIAFPIDSETQALFARHGLNASLQNTWRMQLEPGEQFVYELSRPSGRLFRVGFDLRKPTATPPPAWGAEQP